MRRIINLFKEPIYKDDLKQVLMYGAINMSLFGALAGALQFFANMYLGIGFGLLIYLMAYMIGKEIRDRIYTYHILYSLLAVVFFLVGYVIYNISYYFFVVRDISFAISYVLSWGGIKYLLFGFLNFETYVGIDIFYNILDILIMIFCVSTVWRMPLARK